MGVKDLWPILSPICEKKSLWELQNQTVAIDLSVWICENQSVDYHNNNIYLRNIFFRTSYMLLLGIRPIFVLEGKAPDLKHKVIKQRIETHGKSNSRSGQNSETGKRPRLNSLQKQCEELLRYIGISCVYSEGEAEALCAVLNSYGIVDGVITKDSDCFLYGARTVYRNFNISSNGGTFEEYKMSKIEENLSLGRNKLIALSLLCGCDYNEKGIEGIGKETALKYLSTVAESDVLKELSKWRENPEENRSYYESKFEKHLRQKAVLNPRFPFYDIQKEFLCRQYDISKISYFWKKPNINEFVILVERKLGWNTKYAMEKFLPLMSRWHVIHDTIGELLNFDYIVKKRSLRGVPSYEIKWKNFDQTTIEPASYLKFKYEHAIDNFEKAKFKKSKKVKTKKVTSSKKVVEDLTDELNHMRIITDLCAQNEDSITVSDFECTASELLELSSIVESIISRQ